jgi:hypothetical protein
MVEALASGTTAPLSWSTEELIEEEAERIVGTCLVAFYALQVPKRTGIAGRAAALDKKVSRVIAYGYMTLWRDMNHAREAPKMPGEYEIGEVAAKHDEIRTEGATVEWKDYLKARQNYLQRRIRALAAFSRREAEWKWGALRIRNIQNELACVERAMGVIDAG